MAASIEMRLPLVDQVLLEHQPTTRSPTILPIAQKLVLRRIGLRGLDPVLFERPKTGFELPYDRWRRKGLDKVLDQAMRDADAVRPLGLDPEAVQ